MAEIKTYNGLLGLDNLPRRLKIVLWFLTFALATASSIFRLFLSTSPAIVPSILGWNCIVAACLRLVGIRWRYVLTYLLAMPVFLATIYYLFVMYVLFSHGD